MPQVNPYPFKSYEWYKWTHLEAAEMHDVFTDWARDRFYDIATVLEVGCGLYRRYSDFFVDRGIRYIGLDNDPEIIAARINGSRRYLEDFICTDFTEPDVSIPQADLVFSRAVIDHVVDPDTFLRNAIKFARKYVYIMTYRPPTDSVEHKIEKGNDGYYYNDLSIARLLDVLENERVKIFRLNEVNTGRVAPEIETELHIEVEL